MSVAKNLARSNLLGIPKLRSRLVPLSVPLDGPVSVTPGRAGDAASCPRVARAGLTGRHQGLAGQEGAASRWCEAGGERGGRAPTVTATARRMAGCPFNGPLTGFVSLVRIRTVRRGRVSTRVRARHGRCSEGQREGGDEWLPPGRSWVVMARVSSLQPAVQGLQACAGFAGFLGRLPVTHHLPNLDIPGQECISPMDIEKPCKPCTLS